MKHKLAILILLCASFSANAEFQQLAVSGDTTITKEETTAKAAASFKTTAFQLNANFEIKPEKKLKTFGAKYSPIPQVTVYYGQLSFGGLYTRIKTPCFTVPGALSSVSVPSAGISVTMPTSGTSIKTPKALCLKASAGNFSLTCMTRHKDAKTEHDEYLFGLDYHPPRTRLNFSLTGGSFESQKEAGTRWFLSERPYEREKIKYAVFEVIYNGSYFKLHSANSVSTTPFEKPTGSWRLSTTLTSRFLRLDSGLFWCDADHITIEETFLRKTLVSYVHPQLKSVTLKNGHKIRAGLTFSAAQSYSDGMAPECTNRGDLAFAAEYKTNLLTFSLSAKCENALHGASKQEIAELETNRKAEESGTAESGHGDSSGNGTEKSTSLFKLMDFATANSFLCYTEKTANVLGLGFKAFPLFLGRTQQFSLNANFKVFPLNKKKNSTDASAALTFCPNDKLSFFIKQSADFSVDEESEAGTGKTNIYCLDSVKTEIKARLKCVYKNSSGYLTAKATIKKELDSDDGLAILFYCGATFYIKP